MANKQVPLPLPELLPDWERYLRTIGRLESARFSPHL
jgi:hypothetical protein